jgi:Flp pilus assembly protein TadG
MTPRTGLRGRFGRNGEHGQMVVLFALCLIAIIAMAGLLIDGGMAWANRRQAQAAADTGALAAAQAFVAGQSGSAAALAVAQANGFGDSTTDCSGATLLDNAGPGVTVNRPPLSGPHTGDNNYVEVITTRKMATTFAAAVGQGCWMVSARAVASIGSSSVASCSFCSLNNTQQNHTILLQNGASLRVDGDIYTNSFSGCVSTSTSGGLTSCNDAALCAMKDWKACGDGFDVFGTPPTGTAAYISARTISVVGGWETHDANIVIADSRLAPPQPPPPASTTCQNSPTPPQQLIADSTPSNVCIHMPPIVDPFAGVTAPNAADYTVTTAAPPPSCPAAASSTNGVKAGSLTVVTSITSGNWTICPGKYWGISITGVGTHVVMQSGVYYMMNKGFIVKDGGSVDGSAGVMIYNAQSAGNGVVQISQLDAGTDIPPSPDLVVDNGWDTYPSSPLPSLTFTAGDSPTAPHTSQYTFKVAQVGTAKLAGTLHFYDGSTQLDSPGDPNCPTKTQAALGGAFQQVCKIAWAVTTDVGTHGLSGVFVSSNATYESAEIIQNPRTVVKVAGVVGGTTALKAMSSGPFAGFVIWQAKASAVNMIISPQSALPACSGTWMTDGIPATAPLPCGDMGGIEGTIYSGNATSQVQITASGLADMQIIAGRILVTNGVDARFAFTGGKFALGSIRLVE